jgi:dTMP kinase
MGRGKFITFEGPEGSGKTTQAQLLIARLQETGLEVLYTREPGGTPTGEAIRDILQFNKTNEPISPSAEVLLFAASRAQLVSHVILPALQRGAWVVCDRFADSTTAYQGYGRGFDREQMIAINAFAIDGATPDLTILLDIDLEEGFRRIAERHREKELPLDRIEQEERAFHERVREGYLELAQRWPERFRIINGMDEATAVTAAIWECVSRECRD